MSRAAQLAVELTEKGASNVAAGIDDVTASAKRMGDTVDSASRQAKTAGDRMDAAAGGADELASKGSQAAGAMGGLGSLIGGPFGMAMQTGGIGLQAMADSGDLLNAALENSIVTTARSKVATIGKTVADKASAAATKVMTVAQKALNLAQKASPVLLIVAGVILLVGAIVLAYKRSETFRRIVDKAMGVAKAGVDKVVGAFKALGPVVQKVMAFVGRVVGLYVKVYVTAFQLGFRAAQAAFYGIRDVVANVIQIVTGKVSSLRGKLVDAWDTIRDKGKQAFEVLIAPVQRIIDLVEHLLDRIGSIHLPHIPDINPFTRSSFSSGGTIRLGSTGQATTTETITIPTVIQGSATRAQAEEWMRTVDARLRSLGKQAVFS
jgi:hypothetical protein